MTLSSRGMSGPFKAVHTLGPRRYNGYTLAQMTRMVVFVCEHGAAKSVIAAAWFRRMAADARLDLRATARGTAPSGELAAVAVAGLLRDGIRPEEVVPERLGFQDLAEAWRVVGFAPEVTADAAPDAEFELWTVPPVSDGYDAARDVIVRKLTTLLDDAQTTIGHAAAVSDAD